MPTYRPNPSPATHARTHPNRKNLREVPKSPSVPPWYAARLPSVRPPPPPSRSSGRGSARSQLPTTPYPARLDAELLQESPSVTSSLTHLRQHSLLRSRSLPESPVAPLLRPQTSIPQDPKMLDEKKPDELVATGVLESLQNFLRKCVMAVLSYGPMPKHIAFIMDGNRRYAKSRSIKEGAGHRVGFSALMGSLLYCYEMGVKYITVYAFSIDNFKRDPSEVQTLMELMEEKINELLENRNVINKVNCKINFWGNLDMLSEPVRVAAQKLMASTAQNTGIIFSVCMPYNSTSEIANAVNELCKERRDMIQGRQVDSCDGRAVNGGTCSDISVADLDRHMYTAGCPDPDIVIRTSGETRLSNFLLWQTTFSHLQNPDPLWPEFSWRHLVWAILQYQRVYPYIEQNKRLAKKQL
ncbi:unnamed protein product [Alopecurus aequalis]